MKPTKTKPKPDTASRQAFEKRFSDGFNSRDAREAAWLAWQAGVSWQRRQTKKQIDALERRIETIESMTTERNSL